jgi:hypothetical protein
MCQIAGVSGGIDISMPVSDILEHFNSTPSLAPAESVLMFWFKLPGDARGTSATDQFTSLIPEPSSMAMTVSLLFVLPLVGPWQRRAQD